MQRWIALSLLASTVFLGCAHNAPLILPTYMHTLAIRPFTNKTQQYGLEDPLTLAIQVEFTRDGRYQITDEKQADGVVVGEITRYILDPLSYDANHVPTEYKLTIGTKVSFEDRVKGGTMWSEPDMFGELRYFTQSSNFAGSMTEDQARQVIFDELARDIRTRTLEGLGGSRKTAETTSDMEKTTKTYEGAPLDNNPPPQPSVEPPAPSPTKLPY